MNTAHGDEKRGEMKEEEKEEEEGKREVTSMISSLLSPSHPPPFPSQSGLPQSLTAPPQPSLPLMHL